MISTGIIRSIDSLGRVVLPKELRRTFEITTDTPPEISFSCPLYSRIAHQPPGPGFQVVAHTSRRPSGS